MKLNFPTLLLIFFGLLFFSCNSDDNGNVSEPNCKISKYNKVNIYQSGHFYQTHLVYENDLIHIRQNYQSAGLVSEDEIFYDSQKRISKIIYNYNRPYETYYDLFFYEGNERQPYKRDRVTNTDGSSYTWHETISYDNLNRISGTITFWQEDEFPSESTSFVYENSNLKKYTKSSMNYTDGEIYEQWVYEYSDYDNMKNPIQLIETPFVENRIAKYSQNNYRRYDYVRTNANGEVQDVGYWETSGYEYDANGYPLTVEFLCN